MSKPKSWEVVDDFWKGRVLSADTAKVDEPDLSSPHRRGCLPTYPRLAFEAIMYVARCGCQWRLLPFWRPSVLEVQRDSGTVPSRYLSDAAYTRWKANETIRRVGYGLYFRPRTEN